MRREEHVGATAELARAIWSEIRELVSDGSLGALVSTAPTSGEMQDDFTRALRALERGGAPKEVVRRLLSGWSTLVLGAMGSMLDGSNCAAIDEQTGHPKWLVFAIDKKGRPAAAFESLGVALSSMGGQSPHAPPWNGEIVN